VAAASGSLPMVRGFAVGKACGLAADARRYEIPIAIDMKGVE